MFIKKRFGSVAGKRILKAVGIAAVAAVLCTSCGNPGGSGGGKDDGGGGSDNGDGYTDSYGSVSYGGKTYKTVKIGTQTWFAENLNYDVPNNTTDVCYNNSADSCAKYGRLYNWATAMGIDTSYNSAAWGGNDVKRQGVCPVGWHLPTHAEWSTLTSYVVGGYDTAGKKLKSTSGWPNNGNGTNNYGFSALPGGFGRDDGTFYAAGSGAGGSSDGFGFWWSATEFNAGGAWLRIMGYNIEHVVGDNYYGKTNLLSIRCVQD